MASLILPSTNRQQPQQGVPIDRSNGIAKGLMGAFHPNQGMVRPLGNAKLQTSRDGAGFTMSGPSDFWVASETAMASASPAWTILVILNGSPTSTNSGGVAFYAERPNGTQIVKLGLTGSGASTAQLVVRDTSNNLMLVDGFANVRADNGKRRVLVGTRRAANDHRIYVDGKFDNARADNVGGSFGPTNATIGNDPFDTSATSVGGVIPLVLVWNRSLTDSEIAEVSSNPWQVFKAPARRLWVVPASAPVGNTYILPAAQGSYTLTGNAVGLRAGRRMAAGAGAYALAGNVAKLTVGRRMAAALGAYTLTGNPANLIRGTAPRALQVSGGGYVITGRAATLRVARYLRATPGGYALTGAATGAPILGAAPNIYLATIMSEPVLNLAAPLGPAAVNLIGKML